MQMFVITYHRTIADNIGGTAIIRAASKADAMVQFLLEHDNHAIVSCVEKGETK